MFNRPGSDLYESHLLRYKFTRKFIINKFVLDIACGIGYGTGYIAKYALNIVGADVEEDVINYARQHYKSKNIEFKLVSKNRRSKALVGQYDTIVCLETIEHTAKPQKFLTDIRSYLKKGRGIIILSTPNNFLKVHPPKNRFHTYEFDILELINIIKKIIPSSRIEVYGQGKTNITRYELKNAFKINDRRWFIKQLFGIICSFDAKYTHFLRRLEHLAIYKMVGVLQRDYQKTFKIYKIDPNKNFYNPEVSLIVIKV